MLNVSDISFAYKKNTILNHVSFQVVPGDCVGIIGTNGCGKSTLLSIIAGALIPKSGTITLNHYDIKKNPKEVKLYFEKIKYYYLQNENKKLNSIIETMQNL